jgi:plasmid maintenance system antidote protein VapI
MAKIETPFVPVGENERIMPMVERPKPRIGDYITPLVELPATILSHGALAIPSAFANPKDQTVLSSKYGYSPQSPISQDILGALGDATKYLPPYLGGNIVSSAMRTANLLRKPAEVATQAIAKPVAKAIGEEAWNRTEKMMQQQGLMPSIVPPNVVKEMGMSTSLPQNDIFKQAVSNTPNARITDEGLYINLMRKQKPEQAMTESVRSGVFYLPEGSPSMKHYGGAGGYGGTDKITGETLYKNPLFVKGATGGKAPEAAYAQLTNKNQLKALQDDISSILSIDQSSVKTIIDGKTIDSPVAQRIVRLGGKPETFIENMQSKLDSQKQALQKASKEELLDGVSEYDIAKMDLDSTLNMIDEAKSYIGKKINTKPANLVNVEEFLSKYAPDLSDYASYIIDNSRKGNQLKYALQEAAVAQKVRDAGYDAVIGHSKGKQGPFISEIFDIRESHYPNTYGDFQLNPKFEDMYQNSPPSRKEIIEQEFKKIK